MPRRAVISVLSLAPFLFAGGCRYQLPPQDLSHRKDVIASGVIGKCYRMNRDMLLARLIGPPVAGCEALVLAGDHQSARNLLEDYAVPPIGQVPAGIRVKVLSIENLAYVDTPFEVRKECVLARIEEGAFSSRVVIISTAGADFPRRGDAEMGLPGDPFSLSPCQ